HNTAEVGLFKVLSEGSSAANIRRIEAITGPEAVDLMRRNDRTLTEAGQILRVTPERVTDAAAELRSRVRELEREARRGATREAGETRWRAPVDAILPACRARSRSLERRLTPPWAGDRAPRQLVRSCACLRSITAGRGADALSRTLPASSLRRSKRSAHR